MSVLGWTVANRGYSSHAFASTSATWMPQPVIPTKQSEASVARAERTYVQHNWVEPLWAKLKERHGAASRYKGEGETTDIVGSTVHDHITLTSGLTTQDASTAFATATKGPFGTTLNLIDGTKITVFGVNLAATQIRVGWYERQRGRPSRYPRRLLSLVRLRRFGQLATACLGDRRHMLLRRRLRLCRRYVIGLAPEADRLGQE